MHVQVASHYRGDKIRNKRCSPDTERRAGRGPMSRAMPATLPEFLCGHPLPQDFAQYTHSLPFPSHQPRSALDKAGPLFLELLEQNRTIGHR